MTTVLIIGLFILGFITALTHVGTIPKHIRDNEARIRRK